MNAREYLKNLEKSLVYFDDAELDPDPRDLQGLSWVDIKRDLAVGVHA
jgi:hypothetical protein